jgi:hypothetical protein
MTAASHFFRIDRVALAFLGIVLAAAPARAGFAVFSVGGNTTAASIQPTVDSFRAALGDPNNGNNAGPLASGRREINWDGGGATMASSSGPTLTGFQNTRGATFTTPGTGFLQTPLGDMALTSIDPSYATTFSTFSAQRVFTPLGSNVTDATFSVPGTGGVTAATIAGFGAVFSDVDIPSGDRFELLGNIIPTGVGSGETTIELFDLQGISLGVFNVPAGAPSTAPNGSLSFLGVVANAGERIARVRITAGSEALGMADSNGNPVDVVVMDDFLYSEPVAIPEPTAALLAALGIIGSAATAARRRR